MAIYDENCDGLHHSAAKSLLLVKMALLPQSGEGEMKASTTLLLFYNEKVAKMNAERPNLTKTLEIYHRKKSRRSPLRNGMAIFAPGSHQNHVFHDGKSTWSSPLRSGMTIFVPREAEMTIPCESGEGFWF